MFFIVTAATVVVVVAADGHYLVKIVNNKLDEAHGEYED